jgi:hypothetical protein
MIKYLNLYKNLILTILLLFTNTTYATAHEIDTDIKWDVSKADIILRNKDEIQLIRQGDSDLYYSFNIENLTVSLRYKFCNNKLFDVLYTFPSKNKRVSKVLFEAQKENLDRVYYPVSKTDGSNVNILYKNKNEDTLITLSLEDNVYLHFKKMTIPDRWNILNREDKIKEIMIFNGGFIRGVQLICRGFALEDRNKNVFCTRDFVFTRDSITDIADKVDNVYKIDRFSKCSFATVIATTIAVNWSKNNDDILYNKLDTYCGDYQNTIEYKQMEEQKSMQNIRDRATTLMQ